MKAIKKLFKFLFWTLVVLVVFVLALPLWIGPVATTVANKTVPGIVKTDFHLGNFGLNPYTGACRVGDLQLANPEGFPRENCLELGSLAVDVDVPTVWTKKIHVEEITLDGLTVATTVTGANFKQIAANASGETDEIESARATGGEAAAQQKEAKILDGQRAKAEQKSEEAPHVVIDRLTLKNIVVKINGVPIQVPTLTFEGIGADKEEGASLMDAGQEIYNKVMAAAGSLVGALGDLGKGALNVGTEAANAALAAGTDAANAALSAGTDVANAALAAGTDAANAALSAGTDAANAALNAGTDVAKDIGSSAVNAAKDIGSGAATALGDGANAAMDTLKDAGDTLKNSAKELKNSAKELKNLFKSKK